jgi:hypothetical protein
MNNLFNQLNNLNQPVQELTQEQKIQKYGILNSGFPVVIILLFFMVWCGGTLFGAIFMFSQGDIGGIGPLVMFFIGATMATFMIVLGLKSSSPKAMIKAIKRKDYQAAYGIATLKRTKPDPRFDNTIVLVGYYIMNDTDKVKQILEEFKGVPNQGVREVMQIVAPHKAAQIPLSQSEQFLLQRLQNMQQFQNMQNMQNMQNGQNFNNPQQNAFNQNFQQQPFNNQFGQQQAQFQQPVPPTTTQSDDNLRVRLIVDAVGDDRLGLVGVIANHCNDQTRVQIASRLQMLPASFNLEFRSKHNMDSVIESLLIMNVKFDMM